MPGAGAWHQGAGPRRFAASVLRPAPCRVARPFSCGSPYLVRTRWPRGGRRTTLHLGFPRVGVAGHKNMKTSSGRRAGDRRPAGLRQGGEGLVYGYGGLVPGEEVTDLGAGEPRRGRHQGGVDWPGNGAPARSPDSAPGPGGEPIPPSREVTDRPVAKHEGTSLAQASSPLRAAT